MEVFISKRDTSAVCPYDSIETNSSTEDVQPTTILQWFYTINPNIWVVAAEAI